MLFGAWWRPGTSQPSAITGHPAGARVGRLGNAVLWATPPAWIQQTGDGLVGHLRTGPGDEGEIQLTPRSLRAFSGHLPQLPLYFARRTPADVFMVCSDAEPLHRQLGSATLSLERLVAVIGCSLDADPGRTAWQEIRRLRASERLTVGDGGYEITRDTPRAGSAYLRDDVETLARELRRRLQAAVARAMGDARRVAVLAGGGVDSSGILALALAAAGRAVDVRVEALAQVWAAPGDDRPHLASLERALHIEAVKLTANDASPWFVPSLSTGMEPQIFAGGCSEMLLWHAARARGAESILGGHGGDIISGGDISFAPLLRRGRPLRAITGALRLETPWSLRPSQRLRAWIVSPMVRPLLPGGWLTLRRFRAMRKPWMTKHFLEILRAVTPEDASPPARTPDERIAEICNSPFFGELCRAWGQFSSATGTSAVDVFRDLEFVRFMAQIEPLTLTSGHIHRGLFRMAMRGAVPESVRLRTDKALAQPLIAQAAVGARAEGLLADLARFDRLASLGLVEPRALAAPLTNWRRSVLRGERLEPDDADRSWEWIWPLLAVEAFLRRLDGTYPASTPADSVG